MAFKGYFDFGPPALNAMFEIVVHDRDLRSNEGMKVMIPKTKTQFAERNFTYRGPVYWNLLPVEVKQASSFDNFKKLIKEFKGFE